MNDMLIISEKDTYFVWNMNDEMRIPIKGWDSVLKKYVGLFPDDLFRLRTSCFRNRNYSDEWECCYAPETSAITTRKWIDLCGDWNPTLGPDTFNQLVAYYFSYHDRYNKNKEIRDIVINDFMFEGEGASIGLTRKQKVIRMGETIKPWFTLLSHRILTEASRRSQKIKANIYLNKLLSNNNNMPKINHDASFNPCISVGMTISGSPNYKHVAYKNINEDISWLGTSKFYNKINDETWVLQFSPDASLAMMSDTDSFIQTLAEDAVRNTINGQYKIMHSGIFKWKYALCSRSNLNNEYTYISKDAFAIGDWNLSPRVESAYISGNELGKYLTKNIL